MLLGHPLYDARHSDLLHWARRVRPDIVHLTHRKLSPEVLHREEATDFHALARFQPWELAFWGWDEGRAVLVAAHEFLLLDLDQAFLPLGLCFSVFCIFIVGFRGLRIACHFVLLEVPLASHSELREGSLLFVFLYIHMFLRLFLFLSGPFATGKLLEALRTSECGTLARLDHDLNGFVRLLVVVSDAKYGA